MNRHIPTSAARRARAIARRATAMRAIASAGLVAMLSAPAPAFAQSPPAAPVASAGSEAIVVEGRTKKVVEQTVRTMTQDRSATGQIARWNDPICVNVANLDQPYAGYLIDRIYTIAESLKLRTGKDDCRPDVLIVMTTDADGVARQFGKAGVPDRDLKELLKPRPVRWFNLSETRNADGRPIRGFNPGELDINRTTRASHISEQTREASVTSLVIVDMTRTRGTSWAQLSDYIAFVVVGKPHFGAEYRGPTILALFGDRDDGTAMPTGMTRQDQGFLKGLYGSFDLVAGSSQQSAILDAAEKGADLQAVSPGKTGG